MRAVCWYGPGDVRVEELEKPEIMDPDDAILRVTTAAICGSDLHLYHGKVPKVRPGTTIGHEFVGVVDSVGPGVRTVQPGTRCLASMFTACGRCPACLRGNHLGCDRYAIFGYGDLFGGLAGGQAEYVRVPLADMTLSVIPSGLADEDILFAGDILATAYTGCVAGGIEHGDVVVVVGAGPVGQLAAECAMLFAPAQVFVVDVLADRLRQAAELGATPIDASTGDPLAQLREHTGGARADVVIEAVGNAGALDTTWRLAATGARLALVGFLTDEPFPQSAGQTWLRSLTVTPVLGQPIRYRERLTRLIQVGRVRPARIISERITLDAVPDTYRRLDRRQLTKAVITP
ncbi:theronine dehydrogenase-like Zn-dependent dehydrogenase [Mycobacterium lentiflavum]|uniref:Theronine dehydrogenase-like Zn-dependent dehydrogenase n=1 Tax=Mycobacterium lentiflavum TaxID=141349 RepID=A0A0E4CR37_MYCLN|nr:alcohol dehydrogenase catalytic domain-containing protein [Mycobacterium lentiflavum]CQD23912.1 theronine dehydrogenase-like Zn-dependent dehydrogenase [Mycobacterium lentiflavum]